MPEKQNQLSETVNAAPEKQMSGCVSSVSGEKDVRPDPESAVPQSKFKKMLASINAFLEFLDEEEPEPPPPQEKPFRESAREFIERCRNRDKRTVMLKEFGGWCRTMLLRVVVILFLFALTVWSTIWILNFNDRHRIKFFPPDEVAEYLAVEHESLEAAADRIMPPAGNHGDIPFDRFDAKLVETLKPIGIYGNEYGIYFMTGKDWYNGEHGVFIAKDAENMPPDMNWGLIEGRIYTYAIYN